jgi:L-fucose isomerase-like protein
VDEEAARDEAQYWIENAEKVMEPTRKEVVKSARLALAFEKLLDEEQATVMTADCYGSMYEPLCKSYAFPCLGFARLNDMGLGGICESDLSCAMTHIIFQGLTGKPGFISDPTIDESDNTIILAHCLGTPRMDGPDGPMAPYNLRCVMERRDGVVTQVTMRHGQQVTQAVLVGTSTLPYFTGKIVETPHIERGCRTKATAKIDGDATKLWKNWSAGLHRVTVYGDIKEELEDFCRFTDINMVNEAV